ncbi:MAG: hypothetical protein MAGBODY4_00999 [Candidatus Marinimicrobia bacterium]|nr:hypothetical protein [Candidatus Neomarinimicrobiota bacterium]
MRALCAKYILLLSIILAANTVVSQSALEKAQSAVQEGDFAKAVQAYQSVVKESPVNARAWFGLGRAHHGLEEYDEAIEAYQQADSLGFYPQFVHYNIACSYALSGNTDSAISHLKKATRTGYSNVELLQTDSDLNSVRSHQEFTQIVEETDRNARPCEYDSAYRQLDFWIGEWEVYNPQGQLVGHNRIEKSLKGCMLVENWTGVRGSEGKSINFYHSIKEQWKQQWVGASGYIIEYSGKFVDGAMRFEGTHVTIDGSAKMSRMTLTPKENGHVHQLIEQSTDHGKTWKTWFDGTYVPADSTEG